ncbi:hypothetical protein [Streptomyces sp. GC420]|uniref:hypothetical protein n=1 Tax=Streptomyces sp. GC420 TaxID=2697568 RepID=UPI001414F31D|nr:hypothetical protein [Streptomyces sp. GC420]NBM14129.1 hypothetical protein [Streptomyces sp. GC420]
MEAGPRDRAQQDPVRDDRERAAAAELSRDGLARPGAGGSSRTPSGGAADTDGLEELGGLGAGDPPDPGGPAPGGLDSGGLDSGGLDSRGLDSGRLEAGDDLDAIDGAASFRELRPQRKLRIWQLAPIVGLAAVGSLMFAFPLAFEFGDGGAVVAMLGLLISCCAAGWGMMAARRVGYTWPGLPERGSGRRTDWRVVLVYTAVLAAVVALAVWRVARLR